MNAIVSKLNEMGFSATFSSQEENVISIMNWNYVDGFDATQYRAKVNSKSTIETVLASISPKSYTSLVGVFKSLISNNNWVVYPTTYGIGVSIFGTPSLEVKRIVASIEATLRASEISYKLEYSEGGLVLRFLVSKSKSNLAKIK